MERRRLLGTRQAKMVLMAVICFAGWDRDDPLGEVSGGTGRHRYLTVAITSV
jgi:hypothetical protein